MNNSSLTCKSNTKNIAAACAVAALRNLAVCAMAIVCVGSWYSGVASAQVVIFQDDFNSYANTAALQAAWTNTSGGLPNLGTTTSAAAVGISTSSNVATLSNGVASRSFSSQNVSSGNLPYITLSFDVLSSVGQRHQSIAICDSTGQMGYVIYVDSGAASGAQGPVYALKQNISGTPNFNDSGAVLPFGQPTYSTAISSPPNILSSTPLEHFILTIAANPNGSSTLSLYEGTTANLKWTGNDATPYTTFSTVYLRGNTTGYFDNIVVAVPEPSTISLAIISLLLVGFLVSRHRRSIKNTQAQ